MTNKIVRFFWRIKQAIKLRYYKWKYGFRFVGTYLGIPIITTEFISEDTVLVVGEKESVRIVNRRK